MSGHGYHGQGFGPGQGPGNVKQCPYCGAWIADFAVICQYCQSNLPPPEPPPKESSGWIAWVVLAIVAFFCLFGACPFLAVIAG